MSRVAGGFPDIVSEHRKWIMATAITVGVAVGIFALLPLIFQGLQIRRVQYVYGLFAAAFMFLVMGYGIRHRLPEINAGHLRTWMQSHVYFSVVCFVLFAIHTGFRAGGVLSFLLAVFFYCTMISGAMGWIFFKTAPRMITAVEHYENLYADFPHINRRLLEKGDSLVEKSAAELANFYSKVVRPVLAMKGPSGRHYLRIGSLDKAVEDMMFEHIGRLLADEDKARLKELKACLEEKNEVLFQIAAQRILRGWLVFHIPAACGTMLLLGFHIIAMLYYYGTP